MREKHTYRRSGDVLGGAVVAVHSPVKHPSRSRSPFSRPWCRFDFSVLFPRRFRITIGRSSGPFLSFSPSTAVDSLPFALPPSAPRSRLLFVSWMVGRGWTRSHDSPSADCGGCVVWCLSLSSRCHSTAYGSLQNTIDVNSAWHGRRVYALEGERSRSGCRNWSPLAHRFPSSDVIVVLYRAAGESCLCRVAWVYYRDTYLTSLSC